jgi:2-desacetyl-2-hydroxyethyl bacteriochlorophyllide A dehydrogenase
MKSILIQKPGAFEIIEIGNPRPKDDEILIQIKALSLCNQHDWKVNKGLYRDLKYLEYGVPGFPGHEGAGIVIEVGKDVKNFNIGDHVVMSGLGGPPLYSEFVTRKADQVIRADKHVPLEQVAMSELIGCVHRACTKVPSYQDKSVAISGCGPGGLAAVQLVKVFGANKVVAIDIRPERLILAKELGADSIVNANDEESIFELKNHGVDIVIECSGNKGAYRNAFDLAREAVVIFSYTEGTIEIPLWQMFDHELTIYNSKWLTVHDLQAVVDMITAGKIRTDKMISAKVSFDQYLDAVEMIGRGEVIKVIMVP